NELQSPMAALARVQRADLVLIGTSTGGPQALTRLLAELPGDLASPVAMVLHIPIGYTEALAKRLDGVSKLEVVEAHHGVELVPGRAVLARAGQHLKIRRLGSGFVGHLDPLPISPHVPAVDQLFTSGAEAAGSGALGVVLTGMGDDGLIGSRAIAQAGGSLITEAPASCVVYGMPRVVFEAGIGARAAALDYIPREIIRHVTAD
ncbi:MAG TPA: CheB methylesterase domain-containing protein, partial [Kofleriaceae bacterium]|nr:CheB methylesterase domain-containing protein [Kofleriaceae bacterium]